jgi:flagellar motor switch protein FliN/FliY
MTPDEALTQLAESTAEAVRGVLETFCPGAVTLGQVNVLAPKARPLADFPSPSVATSVSYVDGVKGGNVLVITLAGAQRLAAAMMGMDPDEAAGEALDELQLSAVSEAMNQMMAAAAGATSEVLGTEVAVAPPETRELRSGENADDLCPPTPHATAVPMTVLGQSARLIQLVPNSFTARMTAALDDLGFEVNLRGAADDAAGAGKPSLSGIPMRLSAELGRARMRAERVVGLPAGSVIELDADVDAPLDLLINGVRFATGRLMVTDDGEWAVRVEAVDALDSIATPSQGGPA